jgi:hypothetical protein
MDIEILELTLTNIDMVQPLFKRSKFKPLRFFEKELGQNLTNYWISTITELLRSTQSKGYVAAQDGQQLGILIISDNPWETNLLGINASVINVFLVDGMLPNKLGVATALLNYVICQAKAKGAGFISSKTYTDDLASIHALELSGFLLMDTVVDCHFDYRRTPLVNVQLPLISKEARIRLATQADREQLVYVASQSFHNHFGRFHADERIGLPLATQVYGQWMQSSLDGYADWIHVAEVEDRLVGFSIWKRPGTEENQLNLRVGHYSIAGILPQYHGHGLFTALTFAGMQSLEGVADIIEGPTHVNKYGVHLGYSKLGWRVVSDARHTFHKWI